MLYINGSENVSPTWWYEMIRLYNLINHNTNLGDPWLRTLEHNSVQTCWKLAESKSFNKYLYTILIAIRI